jgi:hypothetical protein
MRWFLVANPKCSPAPSFPMATNHGIQLLQIPQIIRNAPILWLQIFRGKENEEVTFWNFFSATSPDTKSILSYWSMNAWSPIDYGGTSPGLVTLHFTHFTWPFIVVSFRSPVNPRVRASEMQQDHFSHVLICITSKIKTSIWVFQIVGN